MEVNKPVRPPEPVPAWPGHRRAKEFQTKGTRVDGGGGYPGDYPGGDGQGSRKSLVASGASSASGQTQISWTNFDQNHVYFVQALHGNCGKRYLTQTKGVLDSIFST